MTQKSKASGYKRRQAYMRAAGYNVPDDGSWGPWQERIWKKLSTRQKEYSPHLDGLAQSVWDNITGNTTERFDPLDQGTAKTYDPENIDWSKTKRANSKVVDAVSGTWLPVAVGSAVGAAAPAAVKGLVAHPVRTLIKAVPTFAVGFAGGKAVDKVSEAVTGKDFGTNVAEHTPLTPVMGDMFNPGYAVGGVYGNFVGNNLANRNRYTLNYLTPASYKNHAKELVTVATKPFYEAPPTFFNGRKPAWYAKYAQTKGADAAEQRFQNGLVWAGIPEKEAAHPMYVQNADGSYRLTPEGIGYRNFPADMLPDKREIFNDYFTRSGVGGEHSDYTKLGDWMGAKLMQFEDRQKLNPQWQYTYKINKHLNENTAAYKLFDWLGGKSITGLVGYKPFTIKQNYINTGKKVYPLYDDPINTSNVPNFTLLGH